MDPRYETDIDEIVRGMEGEFTARMVVDTLRKMHPNGDKAGGGAMPNTREVAEHLRTDQIAVKTHRDTVNHYRYNKELFEDLEQARSEPVAQHEPPPTPLDEKPTNLERAAGLMEQPPAPGPTTEQEAMRAEMQQRMEAIRNCIHPEGLTYQGPLQVCGICGLAEEHVEDFEKDPLEGLDATRELAKEIALGKLHEMTIMEAAHAYQGFMTLAFRRDKSTPETRLLARRDALRAKGVAEVMMKKAENMDKLIRQTR